MAGVSPAGVCSCLLWGGQSFTGPGGLPRPVWRPFFELGRCLSLPLPGGSAASGGGLWGGRHGQCSPPPFFWVLWAFVPGRPCANPSSVAGGKGLWVWFPVLSCCGSLVVAVACSGRGPLGPHSPPLRFFLRSLLCWRPRGWWCASFPAGGGAGASRESFPPVHRWQGGCGGLFLLAGRRWAGQCGLSASFQWARWASPMVWPGWGGCPPRLSGCVASRLYGSPSCFRPFPLAGGCAFVGRRGPLGCFLFVGGWGFPPPCRFLFFSAGVGLPVPRSALPGPLHALGGEQRG